MASKPHRTSPRVPPAPTQGWKSVLKADPTRWLLEEDNPSVRYLTLQTLLERSAQDPEVQEAKRQIMLQGDVPKVLERQNEDGSWATPEKFYLAKYTGTVWQLIILAELLADPTDPRIRKACRFIVDASQDLDSHGFSTEHAKKTGGGRHSVVIPCLTGNMVFGLIRLGCLDMPAVQRAIDWITTYQRFDDGAEHAPTGWPYDQWEMCWGRHTCHMGVVKAIKALSEIPENERSKEVQRTLNGGVEFMLKHHIHKRSHDLTKDSKPGWKRFAFPLMYQTDILEILHIIASLGVRDPRMQEAVDVLVSKQDDRGRWNMTNAYPGRLWFNIDNKGKPSKWLTLRALTVLKRYSPLPARAT